MNTTTGNTARYPQLIGPARPQSGLLAPTAMDRNLKQTTELVHVLSALSPGEQKELSECETVIKKGWDTFLDVGRALGRIRDQKLYRAEYDTFAVYCRLKWQYGKSHAYRLIAAAEVVESLSPIGDKLMPTHEAQVRPLLCLTPEAAKVAWQQAVEQAGGGVVTGMLVRKVISGLKGTLQEKLDTTKPEPRAKNGKDLLTNALGLLRQVQERIGRTGSQKSVTALLERLKTCLLHLKREHGAKPIREKGK